MLRAVYAPLLVAISFLTILPVGVSEPTDAEISRSRGWYPVVGLLYGLLLVVLLALWVPVAVFPIFVPVAAAFMVVAMAVANRFLHLDGLMDFCDAIWGGQTVERRLEIMRDSRVGSFGVAGCFSVLLIKFSVLLSLMLMAYGLNALLFFPMVSRWTMTLLLSLFPYGRQRGIGSAFSSGARPWGATGFALLTVVAAAWLLLGAVGIVLLVLVSTSALLIGWWASRRLGGGLTGDCYGATNEIMEALALVMLLILLSRYDAAVAVGYGSGVSVYFPSAVGWLVGGWYSYSAS